MHANAAQALYQTDLRPVWEQLYPGETYPAALTFQNTADVNGGAYPDGMGGNIVEVTIGALGLPDIVVKFAIAHEMSHVATVPWLQREGLQKPNEGMADDCKRSEHLADLIAFHTLWSNFPGSARQIAVGFDQLENELGRGDTTHPSGFRRVRLLRQYYEAVARQGENPRAVAKNLGKLVVSRAYIHA